MTVPDLRNTLRKSERFVELAPEYLLHPGRVKQLVKGVHPGILPTLDVPWLKAIAPRTILDVGANTGQFTFAARQVFPAATIYAFEPLPACVATLRERMASDRAFTAFACAVGSEDGRITIHESASSPSSSILPMTDAHTEAFPWTEGGRDIDVELRRLDSVLPELTMIAPVMLKVDVQGYSLEVLKGATATLQSCDLVLVETSIATLYAGESSFDEVYAFMREAGFRFGGFLDQLVHPQTGAILQVDAIFQRAT